MRCLRLRTYLLVCRQLTVFQSVCLSVPFTDCVSAPNMSSDLRPSQCTLGKSPCPRQHPFRLGTSPIRPVMFFLLPFGIAAFAFRAILFPLGIWAFFTVGLLFGSNAKQSLSGFPCYALLRYSRFRWFLYPGDYLVSLFVVVKDTTNLPQARSDLRLVLIPSYQH